MIASSRIKHQRDFLFDLNFSHKEFIRSKEEINTLTKINFLMLIAGAINLSVIIGSQKTHSTKTSKIQVIKGLSSNKNDLKQTEIFSF